MTPTELAAEIGTDPKTVRKFLRSMTPDRATKGGRWTIDPQDVPAIADRFADWKSARTVRFVLDDQD